MASLLADPCMTIFLDETLLLPFPPARVVPTPKTTRIRPSQYPKAGKQFILWEEIFFSLKEMQDLG